MTGSNIVVFCMLITILNSYIVNYNAKCFASSILIHLNRKISLFSQIFKAVATIRGTGKI